MDHDTQNGFGVIEIIITFLLLVSIIFIGWLIISSSTNNGPSGTNNLGSYDFREAGISFAYPKGWQITTYGNSNENNTDTTVRLSTKALDKTSTNNFILDLTVRETPYEADPFDTLPNGDVTKLDNGLKLWQQKENITLATGPAKSRCPIIQIVSNNSFGVKLTNGQMLYVNGSFCTGEKTSTDLSYNQQKENGNYKKAIGIIESIVFK